MKTKADVINEVAFAYNLNNRGYDSINRICCYIDPKTGYKCAVGRYLKDDVINTFPNGNVKDLILEGDIDNLDSYLKEEVQGFNLSFWEDLQIFHDDEDNWDCEGMSPTGLSLFDDLLEKYS